MTQLKDIHQKMQRLLATKDFIIAGGCIVSYVQGESINDIDCFFNNEISYIVALNAIVEAEGMHVEKIKTRKNSNVFELKEMNHPDFPFIDGLIIDLVFVPKLEILSDVIKSFDLEHCCVFYDNERDMIITKDNYTLNYINNKILAFNNFKNPMGELARVSKFVKRGYKIFEKDKEILINSLINLNHHLLQKIYDDMKEAMAELEPSEGVKNDY